MTFPKSNFFGWLAAFSVVLSGSFLLGQTPPANLTKGSVQQAQTDNKKSNSPYKMEARFHLQQGSTEGYLVLQIDLPKGSYVYALTQKGDLEPSKISVVPSSTYTVKGKFNPDRPPVVIENDPVFQQRVEKHKDTIQFFVPLKIRGDVNIAKMAPELVFTGQVCSAKGVCIPIRKKKIKAKFAGYFKRTSQKQEAIQNSSRQYP